MTQRETIPLYVRIPDEYGAMRTKGIVLGDGLYELMPTENYNPAVEDWEFPPGTIVRCVWVEKGWDEPLFLAIARA